MKNTILLLIGSLFFIQVFGQKIVVDKIGLGAQLFEVSPPTSNPLSILGFLKEPLPYIKIVNDLKANSFSSGYSISAYPNFYVQVDWKVKDAQSRFWKRNSIQTGLFISKHLYRNHGYLEREDYVQRSDTLFRNYRLSINNSLQYGGVFVGFARRIRLNNNLGFHIGFRSQGIFAISNSYIPVMDTLYRFTSGFARITNKNMPALKGINYFQWQFCMPFGLIYDFIDHKYSIRLDLMLGVIGWKFKQPKAVYHEAHGIGLSIMRSL